ncbi:hypothetical protein EYR38_000012 [Pleurotus pulmonarius]|nr:hypothetical protein EYR38_000012 [Pleurotus pulmonarius]
MTDVGKEREYEAYERREAEHPSFPLQPEPKIATSKLELAARFKPKTELESAISTLSQRAHLREEDVAETEDSALQAQELTVEEVDARRAELREMRELIYPAGFEDIASRISQTRHIGDCGVRRRTSWTELRLKEDDRERERATLRHKHTGKWTKSMAGNQGLGEDQRRGIKEMVDSVEKLKRKIQEQDSDSEEDDESEEDEEDVIGDSIKARAFEELAHLRMILRSPLGKREPCRERDDLIQELGGNAGLKDHTGDNDSTPVGDVDEDVTVERLGGGVHLRTWGITCPNECTDSDVILKSTDLVTSSPIDARQIIPSRKVASTSQFNERPSCSQQRDLVKLSFAGDNVVQQFEDIKRREVADDAPQEIETMFPG